MSRITQLLRDPAIGQRGGEYPGPWRVASDVKALRSGTGRDVDGARK